MRGEKEIFDLIPGIGEKDERIRGAYMNGSRTNPNVPGDIFQDYDVVYAVRGDPVYAAAGRVPGRGDGYLPKLRLAGAVCGRVIDWWINGNF